MTRRSREEEPFVVDLGAVQNLLAGWWFEYDQGNFEVMVFPAARVSRRMMSMVTSWDHLGLRVTRASRA